MKLISSVVFIFSLAPASIANSNEIEAAFQAALVHAANSSKAGALLDVEGCGISFQAVHGVANRKTKTAMPLNEELRIASVSKLYTAAIVHQLAAEKLLDLDVPVTNYLDTKRISGVPNTQATLRQLLNHTSGIPDYYDVRSYFLWDWEKPIDTDKVLDVARRRKPTNAPGEKYSYSNTNYHLLALAAEAATGRIFADLVQSYIIDKLAFSQTRYNTTHPGGDIHGYGTELRSWVDTWKFAENTGPDGGVTASSVDLRHFLSGLFLDEGSMKLIGDAMLTSEVETEKTRQFATAGAEIYQGRSGTRLIGHTGDTFGYLTFAFAVPDYQATMIGHINANKPDVFVRLLRDTTIALRDVCAKVE